MKTGLFSHITSDRKLPQVVPGMFKLNIRGKIFFEREIRHWYRLPRAMVETPSLEVIKKHVYVAIRDIA